MVPWLKFPALNLSSPQVSNFLAFETMPLKVNLAPGPEGHHQRSKSLECTYLVYFIDTYFSRGTKILPKDHSRYVIRWRHSHSGHEVAQITRQHGDATR